MSESGRTDNPDPVVNAHAVAAARPSRPADWLVPDARRSAIIFLFVSVLSGVLGLALAAGALWQADSALVEAHGNPFFSVLGWMADTPDAITRRSMTALLIHFGACGLVFGCFGKLLIPLQTGAATRVVAWPGRLVTWSFVAAFMLFLVSIPFGGLAVHAMPAAGCLWSFSLFMIFTSVVNAVRGRRCPGMSIERLPLSAWVHDVVSYPALLVTLGFVIVAIISTWRPGLSFELSGERSFWSATAPVFLGLALIVSMMQLFEIGIVLARAATKLKLARGTAIFVACGILALACVTVFAPSAGEAFLNIVARLLIAGVVVLAFLHLTSVRISAFRNYAASAFTERAPFFFLIAIVWCFGESMIATQPVLELTGDGWHEGTMLVAIAGLFMLCASAAVYFWYPRLFRRNLNQAMGRVHFGATIWALLILLVGPAFFKDAGRIHAVGLATLLAAQFPFVINVAASAFKYGNRIYLYPAMLILVEVIARRVAGLDVGILGWIWTGVAAHWMVSLILTLVVLAIMALIDWRLQVAFPPKRKHPRPNRWICVAALTTIWPLVFAPVLLTATGLPISTNVGWTLTFLAGILGLAYAFKRGNRLTFADEVVDNPWRANSLEWYERAHDDAIESFPEDVEVVRGPYEFVRDDPPDDHLPQWRIAPDEAPTP